MHMVPFSLYSVFMLTKSSNMFTEQIVPISCHKNPNFELYFFQKRQMRTMPYYGVINQQRKEMPTWK